MRLQDQEDDVLLACAGDAFLDAEALGEIQKIDGGLALELVQIDQRTIAAAVLRLVVFLVVVLEILLVAAATTTTTAAAVATTTVAPATAAALLLAAGLIRLVLLLLLRRCLVAVIAPVAALLGIRRAVFRRSGIGGWRSLGFLSG